MHNVGASNNIMCFLRENIPSLVLYEMKKR